MISIVLRLVFLFALATQSAACFASSIANYLNERCSKDYNVKMGIANTKFLMEVSQKIISDDSLGDSQKLSVWKEQVERWQDEDYEFHRKLTANSSADVRTTVMLESSLMITAALKTFLELRGTSPTESRVSRIFIQKCELETYKIK